MGVKRGHERSTKVYQHMYALQEEIQKLKYMDAQYNGVSELYMLLRLHELRYQVGVFHQMVSSR